MSGRILDAPTCDEVWASLEPGDSKWTRLAIVHVGPFTASIKRVDSITDAGECQSDGMHIVIDNYEYGDTIMDHDLGAKPGQVADLELLVAAILGAYRQLDPEALR